MYRTLLGIVAAVAVALLIVGFTFSRATEERADYVFVNHSEPKTLDPQRMTGQPEGQIADALFEGLTYNDARTLKPTPGSAESWEVSPEGLRWTFRIREAARWSNGEPVTARDFVFAWVRLQEPKTASEYAYLMHVVRHAEAYNTYGGHVRALRGDPKGGSPEEREGILAGLERLVAAHPGGVPASAWQTFVEKRHVSGAVTRAPDAALTDALVRSEGTFSPEESRALHAGLVRETERREAALAAAREHFGKDQGVFATDDRTFVVELNAFTPYFLELTAFYPTHPVHRPVVERWPENWFVPGRIVGNGPFVMEKWEVNSRIRMRKSPTYWGRDEVHLETVEALPIENAATALNLYLTGAVDWASRGYPVDLIDEVKTRPDFYANPGSTVYYYRFNCTKKPFDDARVRQAFSLAFDRKVLVEQVTRAGQVPATTIVAPGLPGYESPPNDLGFDPGRARRLLAEAGYPGGRNFPGAAVLFNTDEGHKKIADYITSQWRKNLGVDVNAKNEEWQSYQETTRRMGYQIARAAWIADYRDPNTFLDMWITNGGNNQTGWGDPFYDRLIALAADPLGFAALEDAEREAVLVRFRDRPRADAHLRAVREEADPAKRLAAAAELRFDFFREAEGILFRQAFPVCPIYFYVYTNLVSPRVEGWYHQVLDDTGRWISNLQDMHPYRDLRVRPPRSR